MKFGTVNKQIRNKIINNKVNCLRESVTDLETELYKTLEILKNFDS